MSLKRAISNAGHLTRAPLILPKGVYALRPGQCRRTRLGVYPSYSTAHQPLVRSLAPSSQLDHRELFERVLKKGGPDHARAALITLLKVSNGRFEPLSAYGTSKEGLVSLMNKLMSVGYSTNLSVIDSILKCMQSQWNLHIDNAIHTMIVGNLARTGQHLSAIRWLSQIREKPGNCHAVLDQWHLILEGCREDAEVGFAHTAMRSLRQSGCQPTGETYKLLLSVLFSPTRPPRLPNVFQVIHDMVDEKIPFTPMLRDSLMTEYRARGRPLLAASVGELWHRLNDRQPTLARAANSEQPSLSTRQLSGAKTRQTSTFKTPTEDMNKTTQAQDPVDPVRKAEVLAEVLADAGGKGKASKLFKQYRMRGFVPTTSTLVTMSRSISIVKDLLFWAKALGVEIEPAAYANIIRNARTPYQAIQAYEASLSQGHQTLTVLYPLLQYFMNFNQGRVSKETIGNALRRHADYVEYRKDLELGLDLEQPQRTSELAAYSLLLRMITSSRHTALYFPKIFELVLEMRERGLQMSGSTAASFIIALMRASTTLEDAFKLYRAGYKDREGQPLLQSSGDYAPVIKAFGDLPFVQGLAPVAYHFKFIQDVRDAKLSVTAEIYTVILNYYGREASSLPADDTVTRQKFATIIQRLHDMITVDASLVPDIALWNQLMDSYQRVRCFDDAYQLWKTMYMTKKFDHTSVSIITDACAFAGAHQAVVDIYKDLNKVNFELNKRNWINWLECLCRLGKFDEAMKFVCLQMGRDEKTVAPDEDVVRLLLKFSIAENQVGETRKRLKSYLPALWANLPMDLRDM